MKRRTLIGTIAGVAVLMVASPIVFLKNATKSIWAYEDLKKFKILYAQSKFKWPSGVVSSLNKKGLSWPLQNREGAKVLEEIKKDIKAQRAHVLNGWLVSETEIQMWAAAYEDQRID